MKQLLVLFTMFAFQLQAQSLYPGDIGVPAEQQVCIDDIDGDGQVNQLGEFSYCTEGQVYDPQTDWLGNDGLVGPAYICPMGRAECSEEPYLICPYTGNRCAAGATTCDRPTPCVETSWDETHQETRYYDVIEIPGSIGHPCEWNGRGYSCPRYISPMYPNKALCESTESTCHPDVPGEPATEDRWHCTKTGRDYPTEAQARAACERSVTTTHQVTANTTTTPGNECRYFYVPRADLHLWRCDAGTMVNYSSNEECMSAQTACYPGTSVTRWVCSYNGQTYNTEVEARAACTVTSTVFDPYYFIPGNPGTPDEPGNPCMPSTSQWYCPSHVAPSYSTLDLCNASSTCTASIPTRWKCTYDNQFYATFELAQAACTYVVDVTTTVNGWDCPLTPGNDRYTDQNMCNVNCVETSQCDVNREYVCPLDSNVACVNDEPGSGDFFCSLSQCAAFGEVGETTPVDITPTLNDGTVTEVDGCLDQILIFNGKAQSCRLPGIASAYMNCCTKADEDLLYDSTGSALETSLYTDGIAALGTAASEAYTAYETAMAVNEAAAGVGGAVTDVASFTFSEFSSTLMESLTSTTMYVGIAVAAIMTYLENACPPDDIATALMNKSKQCVKVGEICTTRVFGQCVQEREVHCCFNSRMAQLIHVGGRPQLGMGYGTAEAPECRGFTPEEFQSLDFSKIDLTEYYEELRVRAQGEIEEAMDDVLSGAINAI